MPSEVVVVIVVVVVVDGAQRLKVMMLTGEQDGESCFSMYGIKICRRASLKNRFRTVLLS